MPANLKNWRCDDAAHSRFSKSDITHRDRHNPRLRGSDRRHCLCRFWLSLSHYVCPNTPQKRPGGHSPTPQPSPQPPGLTPLTD